MKKLAFAALAVAAAFATQADARALAPMAPAHAGTLTCNLDAGFGLVLGSFRQVDCSYEHLNRRGQMVRESYVGTMKRVGIDLGLTGPQTISWNVITMGGRNRAGMMAGDYKGSSSEASLIAGPGTLTLFGEHGDGVKLETVSNSGQFGFGFSVGLTGIELIQVPNSRVLSMR